MDEKFKGKEMWVGLGALAIVFLCVMLCALGAMSMLFMRNDVAYVQPPVSEEGVVPPPVLQGHGPLGMGRHGHFGPFSLLFGAVGFLFKFLFFGLLLLLLLGLVKRVFWGPRYWHTKHWGAHHGGKPPKGKPHGWWGPWAWHCHGGPWEEDAETPAGESESDADEAGYSGPQE